MVVSGAHLAGLTLRGVRGELVVGAHREHVRLPGQDGDGDIRRNHRLVYPVLGAQLAALGILPDAVLFPAPHVVAVPDLGAGGDLVGDRVHVPCVQGGVGVAEVPVDAAGVAGVPGAVGVERSALAAVVEVVGAAHVQLGLLVLRVVVHLQPGALGAVVGVVGVLVVPAEEEVQVSGGSLVEETAPDRLVGTAVYRGAGARVPHPFPQDEVGCARQRGLVAGEVHGQVGRIEYGGGAALVLHALEGPGVEALEIDEGVDRQAVEHVPLVGVREAARGAPVGVVAGQHVGEVARAV